MGVLYILESSRIDNIGNAPVHLFDIGTGLNCTQLATSTSSASQQLDTSTRYVTIKASEDMYIEFGGSAVEAGTSDYLLGAGQTLSFAVSPGSGNYIAAEDAA